MGQRVDGFLSNIVILVSQEPSQSGFGLVCHQLSKRAGGFHPDDRVFMIKPLDERRHRFRRIKFDQGFLDPDPHIISRVIE